MNDAVIRMIALAVMFALMVLCGIFSWATPMAWWRDALLLAAIMLFALMATSEEKA